MEPPIFWDELTDAQQQALAEALKRDPDLARMWIQWEQILHQIRERLPDTRLFVLYALGRMGLPLTEEEASYVETHRQELEEALTHVPALSLVVTDIQETAQAFDALWRQHAPELHRHRRPRRRMRLWHAAALTLVALIAILTWNYVRYRQGFVEVRSTARELLTLGDGSQVLLHPGTLLRYHPKHPRRVELQEGRALFDVLPHRNPPFQVQTPVALVMVTGTTFGVSTTETRSEVVLAHGTVVVSPRSAPEQVVTLQPGTRVRVEAEQPPSPPEPVNLNQALAWTGLLFFTRTPVETIARELEQRYNVRIEVDPRLAAEPVTATLEAEEPVEDILQALALTLNAHVERTGERTFRLQAES